MSEVKKLGTEKRKWNKRMKIGNYEEKNETKE
jgi:hypothetical protein